MKKLLALVLVAVVTLSLVSVASAAAVDKKTVVIATAQEPTVFFCQDQNYASNQAKDSPVLFQIYECLLWMDEEGVCQPWLATGYEMSEDGLEYVFTLRDDVYFHNGEKMTAEDVAAVWDKLNIAERLGSVDGVYRNAKVPFGANYVDSDLDIDGVYTTKASIATLIADTASVSSRRTVNCGIGISGKLREPQLTFSIDVPDIDPTTKANVESALNTEDKVQRQFLALLISGGFMPEEQSGIVNNTSNLYTNLAEIMAGQLNNILQKLDIPLDFGLNYQSSQSGSNIFDVAVSTQLFNNRVIVNGNVGNREYGNSSQGDVVGDLDIEIKLDKPGQVRLKLFSHSADDYTNFLDNYQRNGVGVTYQKEFSTFRELARSIFTSRKKRQERANAPVPEKEFNRISITE